MKNGAIYIMINRSYQGLVKIGYTTDVDKMVDELNKSAVTPYPYHIYAKYEVPPTFAEDGVQRIIDRLMQGKEVDEEQRELQERGFYSIEPNEVYKFFEDMAIIHGKTDQLHKYPETEQMLKEIEERERTTEEAERYEKRRSDKDAPMRKKQFQFSMIGLKPGDMIQFKNDPSLSIKIISDKVVEYEGEPYSLTALARKLTGKGLGVQGTVFFTYNGEELDKIRKRMEGRE